MSKAANRVHLANAMILWKVVPIKREWTDTLSLFPWEMKDSRQVRCIGPICVIFLCLPIIIVVIFFIFFQCFLDRFHPYRLLFFCEGGGGVWSNPLYLSLLRSLTVWTFNIQRKPLQQSFLSLMKDNVWNPFVRQNSSCVEKSIYVVVNFLSQVIFLFLFFFFFSTSLATLPYPKTKKNYLR